MLKAHQATHAMLCVFLGFCQKLPGGMNGLPGDITCLTQIMGFWYDSPGSDEHPLGDVSQFVLVWVSMCSGGIVIRENGP